MTDPIHLPKLISEQTVTVELTLDQAKNLREAIDKIAQQTFGDNTERWTFSPTGWRDAALADKALFDAISAAEASSEQDGRP